MNLLQLIYSINMRTIIQLFRQKLLCSYALCLLCAACITAQAQTLQVSIKTEPSKANFILTDKEGHTIGMGRTPANVMVEAGKEYYYKLRQPYCEADSGTVVFTVDHVDTTFVLRPYSADIHWEVTPRDAEITIVDRHDKHHAVNVLASEDLHINAGLYTATFQKKDYRRHVEKFRLTSDTTITYSYRLQHCPPRLTLALSGGLSPRGGLPLGITAAYGGVHGFYGRFVKTWFNVADGDEFTESVLVDALYNPYSDVKSEYMSAVVGYQYYTPWSVYLQLGVGYGKLQYNWLSSDDDQRHIYSPDDLTGVVIDLGAGYPMGRYYVGAALQTVIGSAKSESVSMPPVIGLLNFGINL